MPRPYERSRAPGAAIGPGEGPRLASFSATLRARIAHELREGILTGQVPAGSALGLDQLATVFGSSRTPVREALIELEQDGLVKITPRSGVRVASVSSRELVDNFSLFAVLSGVAAEWASQRMTPERLRRIHDLNDRVESAVAERPEDLVLANWKFHREINLAAQSERLRSLLRRTSRVVPARFLELIPDQAEITAQDHRAILDALEAGDGERSRTLAEAHVARAGELLAERLRDGSLSQLPEQGPLTSPGAASGDQQRGNPGRLRVEGTE
ncbi:MAG: GntR family transcriptional regulator [Micromonosporaceae bacterium]